ncbi:MAG: HesA/MoeB/ThiF family protein [Bacillota bacterium]|nr:HesA/MoeB/ThiF family protein [Bacillota bacterium]MDW7683086.1 HesA/MoeB/ThiF family protein [Bacillota bacterium]
MTDLRSFLTGRSNAGLLSWQAQEEAAAQYGLTLHEVEEAVLAEGIMPARYQRNSETIPVEGQYILCQSRVAVIGCGGLGGHILEQLARLGVGRLVVVDFDKFEEHNLNRQLLASPENLGQNKAAVAAERIKRINPAVETMIFKEAFGEQNGSDILQSADVAVDALDSIPARRILARTCSRLAIPMVHGAICGWYGQITTQFPGDDTLDVLYRACAGEKGMEKVFGNPSFTPAVIAGLQVAEVCKILLGQGTCLRRKILYLNLLDMELEELQL